MIKKTAAAFAAILIITQFLLPFFAETPMYGGEVVRLHVIANSNSTFDQELKLKVRDAVLAASDKILSTSSGDEASEIIFKNISEMEKSAKNVVEENGRSYNVSVIPGIFDFPARTYQNITLPKGKYRAVRVVIGEGKGKNWWCVMFPPLCFTDKTTAYMPDADVLGNTGEVKIKVKLLEILAK